MNAKRKMKLIRRLIKLASQCTTSISTLTQISMDKRSLMEQLSTNTSLCQHPSASLWLPCSGRTKSSWTTLGPAWDLKRPSLTSTSRSNTSTSKIRFEILPTDTPLPTLQFTFQKTMKFRFKNAPPSPSCMYSLKQEVLSKSQLLFQW